MHVKVIKPVKLKCKEGIMCPFCWTRITNNTKCYYYQVTTGSMSLEPTIVNDSDSAVREMYGHVHCTLVAYRLKLFEQIDLYDIRQSYRDLLFDYMYAHGLRGTRLNVKRSIEVTILYLNKMNGKIDLKKISRSSVARKDHYESFELKYKASDFGYEDEDYLEFEDEEEIPEEDTAGDTDAIITEDDLDIDEDFEF